MYKPICCTYSPKNEEEEAAIFEEYLKIPLPVRSEAEQNRTMDEWLNIWSGRPGNTQPASTTTTTTAPSTNDAVIAIPMDLVDKPIASSTPIRTVLLNLNDNASTSATTSNTDSFVTPPATPNRKTKKSLTDAPKRKPTKKNLPKTTKKRTPLSFEDAEYKALRDHYAELDHDALIDKYLLEFQPNSQKRLLDREFMLDSLTSLKLSHKA